MAKKTKKVADGQGLATSVEKCCICGCEIYGYSNNARPYKEGVCCSDCNAIFVIPARLGVFRKF